MRVYKDRNPNVRSNLYRFADGCWEFNDGVGPWAPSGMLSGKTEQQGIELLAGMSFVEVREVPQLTT